MAFKYCETTSKGIPHDSKEYSQRAPCIVYCARSHEVDCRIILFESLNKNFEKGIQRRLEEHQITE